MKMLNNSPRMRPILLYLWGNDYDRWLSQSPIEAAHGDVKSVDFVVLQSLSHKRLEVMVHGADWVRFSTTVVMEDWSHGCGGLATASYSRIIVRGLSESVAFVVEGVPQICILGLPSDHSVGGFHNP